MTRICPIMAFVLLASCGGKSSSQTTKAGPEPTVSLPPTATEVFHLRSECAQLGEKILAANVIGVALTHDQVSHYDPKTNRCYVQVTVQTNDLTKSNDYYATYLYDGQTSEMLAWARIEHGKKSGNVFGLAPPDKKGPDVFWDQAIHYMNDKMEDDRQN